MKISNAFMAPQAAPPTPKADATPDRNVFTKEELQSLRNQVRQGAPHPITIHGSNGQTTVIDLPAGFSAKNVIPPQAVDISIAFFLTMAFIIVGLPIARALARRMDRRGAGSPQIPGEVTAQLTQLNQAVDAIALEVERISEGQRFTTRLLSEQRDASRQTLPASSGR
jgi:hypothetical protein